MPVTSKNELMDRKAQESAYLFAVHDFSQEKIGRYLHCSQSQVSRLLKRAEQAGWLIIERRFSGVSKERLRELGQLLEPKELMALTKGIRAGNGVVVSNIRVFDSGPTPRMPTEPSKSLVNFGHMASGRLAEILRDSSVVGVSWGKTVGHMIDSLRMAEVPNSVDNEKTFVPLCAELISEVGQEFSSTILAGRLDDIFNRGSGKRFSLSGIPAYLPLRYSKDKDAAKVLREYIDNQPSYREIFAGRESLTKRLDTYLTSVGPADRPLGKAVNELLAAGEIEISTLKTLVVGDVGGVLIAKQGLNEKAKKRVDQLNKIWTGIRLPDLARIAEKAVIEKKPGNVVIATGESKAKILIKCLQLGLINELIIDTQLEEALVKILKTSL